VHKFVKTSLMQLTRKST